MANDRQSQQRSERAQTGAPSAQQGDWQPSVQRQGAQLSGGTREASARTAQSYPAARAGIDPGHYGPFAMMRRLGDEMDRLFDSFGMGRAWSPSLFGGRWGGEPVFGSHEASALWSPSIDVCERENRFCVTVDLPGLKKDDVSVQIEKDAIVVQGQRNDERTTNEEGYYQRERRYGQFYRAIPLPEGARSDEATATFENGVLKVEMPSTQPSARGRRLEIRDGRSANAGESATPESTAGRAPTASDRSTGSDRSTA
jgi:HSP20 family protein